MAYALRSRDGLRRFTTYLIVGGLNTVVGYLLFASLVVIGATPAIAAIGSTCLGVLFNFQSVGKLVFASTNHRVLPRFLAVYSLQYVVNITLLHLLAIQGIEPLVGQAIVVPFLAILSFMLMRRYVFTTIQAAERGK